MLGDFLRGATYVPRGLRMLNTVGLRRYVWLPVVVNVLVFAGLFWIGADWLQSLMNYLVPEPAEIRVEGWLGAILDFLVVAARWLLWPLFLLMAFVVMFYTFTAVANLIGSPFNGMLSARVEAQVTGRLPREASGGGLFVDALGAIRDELRKIAYFVLLAAPLLILFFVPVANLLTSPLWLLYGAWIMALEYMDYPLGNRGIAFKEQRRLVRGRRMLHLGFGAGLLAITLIPVANLIAMPTGVIGATLLRLEQGER
ncbi:MAG: sulfate transporter CysZ [Nitrococcus sp.]|nr:sulfate transporter CysZ [Nitrococcus sp.]